MRNRESQSLQSRRTPSRDYMRRWRPTSCTSPQAFSRQRIGSLVDACPWRISRRWRRLTAAWRTLSHSRTQFGSPLEVTRSLPSSLVCLALQGRRKRKTAKPCGRHDQRDAHAGFQMNLGGELGNISESARFVKGGVLAGPPWLRLRQPVPIRRSARTNSQRACPRQARQLIRCPRSNRLFVRILGT